MFSHTDFIIFGMKGLINAFKAGMTIDGNVLEEALEDLEKYEEDYYYEDFDYSNRWDISKAYIYKFEENGKFYRVWRRVALTELQESYFVNQKPEEVERRVETKYTWS